MKALRKIIGYLVTAAIVVGLAFYFESDLNLAWHNLKKQISPCGQPIAYSIGDLDKRFGLSQSELLDAIDQAARIWDRGAERSLFAYVENTPLKVNLIYDARQDSTLKLKDLGFSINQDQASYETLKIKHEAFLKDYNQQKLELDNAVNYYNQAKSDYEDEVKAADRRGVSPAEYDILEQERQSLNNLVSLIKSKQLTFNKTVADLNALANVINRLIYELNLNVENYNTVGAAAAGEFQEGAYIKDLSGEKINIYQFDNKDMLVRVLAHELGHALGLEHVDNPQAIMYRLNESGNNKLTPDDLKQLGRACRLKLE